MSQLLACCCSKGVVLASDRQVVHLREGRERACEERKLFPLGRTAAVTTSGAAMGIAVSRTLSRLLRGRTLPAFDELETYVMDVFQREYDEFVRQGGAWFAAHPDAHRLSYVLLGGRTGDGYGFRFYASETHGEPYRPWKPGAALTALRRVARHDPAVAGPFDVAVISAQGTRMATFGQDHQVPRATTA